jgi:intracellular multiplication protein IcmP
MEKKGNADFALIALLLAIFVFVIVGCVVWYKHHPTIAYWTLYFSWKQLAVIDWPSFPIINQIRGEIIELALNPGKVSLAQTWTVLNKGGYVFFWVPILLTVFIILKSLNHRSEKVRRVITASTLPRIMSAHSPAIIPVLHYGDLLNKDVPGQESRVHPEEFVVNNKLIDPLNKVLDEERTKRILIENMGRKIFALEDLNQYERALFAVFAIRIFDTAENAKKAQDLLDQLNRSCDKGQWKGLPGYPNFSIADKTIKKYMSYASAKKLVQHFPYPCTLLRYMHQAACLRGKLPSSHFRWLKGIDRGLWYTLNNTGRKTPCIESIVQVQNYHWQKLAYDNGFSLSDLVLEDSIEALKVYLIKYGYLAKSEVIEPTVVASIQKDEVKDEESEGPIIISTRPKQ